MKILTPEEETALSRKDRKKYQDWLAKIERNRELSVQRDEDNRLRSLVAHVAFAEFENLDSRQKPEDFDLDLLWESFQSVRANIEEQAKHSLMAGPFILEKGGTPDRLVNLIRNWLWDIYGKEIGDAGWQHNGIGWSLNENVAKRRV